MTYRPTTSTPGAFLILALGLFALCTIFAGSAAAEPTMHDDGAGFESAVDPAEAFFDSPVIARHWSHALAQPSFDKQLDSSMKLSTKITTKNTDTVYRLEHDIHVPNGDTLRVVEHFTLGSWLRWPHRAVLMTTSFTSSAFSIPVEGYDMTDMLAREGFFTFSVDLIGYGESSKPANGNDATFARHQEALEAALRYIRFFRLVPKVDVYGEGLGGALASQLAADATRVRSAIMTDQVYLEQIAGPSQDPAFRAFVESDEDGYIFVAPEVIQQFLITSPPEVADYFASTQSGLTPATAFTLAFDLPFFDPREAAVPGLYIQSELDFEIELSDTEALVADYGATGGGEATLLVVEGAPRGARFGAPDDAAFLQAAVMDFLDP